jgi:hypothetical protein
LAGNAHLAEHLQTSHVVAENFADVMKEILPIDECKGTLDGWLDGHEASKKITRLRPLGRVSRVRSVFSIRIF